MNLNIPLYIKLTRPTDAPLPVYVVRPLFFRHPSRNGELLSRATAKLAADLREKLDAIGREPLQQELAAWAFSPELTEHRVVGEIALRRQTAKVHLLAVSFESGGRRLAFFPDLHDLWFQVPRGQAVASRGREVLGEYLLKCEKEEEEAPILKLLRERGQSWLSSMDLEVACDPKLPEEADLRPFLMLGEGDKQNGHAALERVGRCLDRLYPDDLDRVVEREDEVEELNRRMAGEDRRPLLLLGPRSVGKSAIVQECVWRRVGKTGNPHRRKRNVWLLAPHRLISGMSYVGQWEGRVIAILKGAKHRDHILYFDDVLGLYSAGMSSKSSLSVGDILRPYVERRDVRIIAEMTPEAFGVLQERDRAMADLFHVISVHPTGEDQTRRILFSVTRQLEAQHGCRFKLDALPTSMDLQRRYVTDLAMPGKAAGFLRQLAVKHSQKPIDRAAAMAEFGARSGLSLAFLDDRARLPRGEIIEQISKNVIGQTAAVEAMADAVCIAKARLNDANRPLSTLLFPGPTGVGKTQCAKALSGYLYGDEQRLIRIDMNEFLDGAAASRLVGTFFEPEGILTSAIRRRPFSVVLLDEIEKAHASVFDLLLQVLGEGRLTDAHGRTASFANAIIVMTSNLGAREAMMRFGLRPGASGGGNAAFRRSAEKFFRPEFYNRIDRIVPFEQLSREHVGMIATRLISEIFHREGLVNRRCVLQIEPVAMKNIVDAGYHPDLGARALKREVERQIAAPVARRLAMLPTGSPMVVSVHSAADGVIVDVQELTNSAPVSRDAADFTDPTDALDSAEAALARIEASVDEADTGVALTQGQLSQEQFRYLVIREQVRRVENLIDRADDSLKRRKPGPRLHHAVRRSRTPVKARIQCDAPSVWDRLIDIAQAENLADLLPEHVPDQYDDWKARFQEIQHELAMLEAMAALGVADRVILVIRPLAEAPDEVSDVASIYLKLFDAQHAAVRELTDQHLPHGLRALIIETPGAGRIVSSEQGTHLLITSQGRAIPIQMFLIPLDGSEDPLVKLLEELERQRRFRESVAREQKATGDDPARLQPVIRVYEHKKAAIDLRSGLAIRNFPTPDDLRRFIMEMLPLPEELRI